MTTLHATRHAALRLGLTGLLLGVVALGSANIAFAVQLPPGTPVGGTPGFTMTFDENSNATINGQPVGAVPLGVGIDYILPGPVAPGQVLVLAPGDISPTNPNGFSDVLTFFSHPDGVFILFYQSLLDDTSPPDTADVANLIQPNTPFAVMETGPEGNNGFQWIATDPSTGLSAIYNGISDVPEPSTFILGGLGIITLFLIGRRPGALKKV
jgi:hypothetical protein